MKTIKSKKLNKQIDTICDFNSPYLHNVPAESPDPSGTDPTNATMTIVVTTINTQVIAQKLNI